MFILQNILLSCHFLQVFYESPLRSWPHFVKKRQFCQDYTIYYGPKKSIGCPFFQFHEKKKCSHAHVLSKNVHSLKTNCSRAHVLSCKRLFFPKHCALMYFFFIFCMKNSCYHAHIWSKKTSILPKLDYILGQKSQRDAFFFDFSRKINCSHALILPKITSIL